MNRAMQLLSALFLLALAPAADAAKIRIVVETPGDVEQNVYLSRPVNLAADRPVIFVLHDAERDAIAHRDQWHALAEALDFLLVVPEFSERHYPGVNSYSLGNVLDDAGRIRPRAEWSFSVLEPIFDEVRRRYGMTARAYAVYGHAAGAQFLHRFLFHVPGARVRSAVAANADWYTMPVFDTLYPYGLRHSAVEANDLEMALKLPLTVLLGAADTDPLHPDLRRTPDPAAQGPHRLARGRAFFDSAADAASALAVPFGWHLLTVPGAGHDNRQMMPAAVPLLLRDAASEASGSIPPRESPPRMLPQTGP